MMFRKSVLLASVSVSLLLCSTRLVGAGPISITPHVRGAVLHLEPHPVEPAGVNQPNRGHGAKGKRDGIGGVVPEPHQDLPGFSGNDAPHIYPHPPHGSSSAAEAASPGGHATISKRFDVWDLAEDPSAHDANYRAVKQRFGRDGKKHKRDKTFPGANRPQPGDPNGGPWPPNTPYKRDVFAWNAESGGREPADDHGFRRRAYDLSDVPQRDTEFGFHDQGSPLGKRDLQVYRRDDYVPADPAKVRTLERRYSGEFPSFGGDESPVWEFDPDGKPYERYVPPHNKAALAARKRSVMDDYHPYGSLEMPPHPWHPILSKRFSSADDRVVDNDFEKHSPIEVPVSLLDEASGRKLREAKKRLEERSWHDSLAREDGSGISASLYDGEGGRSFRQHRGSELSKWDRYGGPYSTTGSTDVYSPDLSKVSNMAVPNSQEIPARKVYSDIHKRDVGPVVLPNPDDQGDGEKSWRGFINGDQEGQVVPYFPAQPGPELSELPPDNVPRHKQDLKHISAMAYQDPAPKPLIEPEPAAPVDPKPIDPKPASSSSQSATTNPDYFDPPAATSQHPYIYISSTLEHQSQGASYYGSCRCQRGPGDEMIGNNPATCLGKYLEIANTTARCDNVHHSVVKCVESGGKDAMLSGDSVWWQQAFCKRCVDAGGISDPIFDCPEGYRWDEKGKAKQKIGLGVGPSSFKPEVKQSDPAAKPADPAARPAAQSVNQAFNPDEAIKELSGHPAQLQTQPQPGQ